MKYLIIIFVICFNIFGKDTTGAFKLTDIPQDCKYIQIIGTTILGIKLSISIDYGQSLKDKIKGKGSIKKDGKYFSFNSMIEALNYFYNNGWEFQAAYAITRGNHHIYHFILKRINNGELP